MKSKIVILLTIFMSATTIADVTVPFEYLYGRWVDGHYFNGFVFVNRNRSSLFDDEYRTGDYQFTNDKFRIGVERLQDYLLFSANDSSFYTPEFYFGFRPATNWQIQLKDLHHSYYRDDYGRKNYTTHFSIESIWLNNNNLQISSKHVPYSYLFSIFYPDKAILVTNSVNFSIYKSNQSLSNSSYYYNRNSHTKKFSNSLLWGIQGFNIGFNLGLSKSINDYSTRQSITEVSQYDYSDRFTNYDEIRVNYSLLFLSSHFAPVYLKSEITQIYNDYKESSTVIYYKNDSILSFNNLKIETDFHERNTQVLLQSTFINRGKFVDDILLDDYKNYYSRFLFHRQILLDAVYIYDKDIENLTEKSVKLTSGIGVLNKVEIKTVYSHLNSERITHQSDSPVTKYTYLSNKYKLDVRYRSYDYMQNNNYHWDTNTRYYKVFDPILQPFHYILQFSYERDKSEQNYPIGSEYILIEDDEEIYSFSCRVGIGFSMELYFNYKLFYEVYSLHRILDDKSMDLSYKYQIYQKLQLYSNVYYTKDEKSKNYYYNLTLGLELLL